MLEIIKITTNDDSFASENVDVMFCGSIEECEEKILSDLNNEFEECWGSLKDVVSDLENDLLHCSYYNNVFEWHDNGKGVVYIIGSVDIKSVFQHFN